MKPTQLGYYMPAEWAIHEATWLSWPKNAKTWPEQLESVEEIYGQMIEALTPSERVYLLVNDQAAEDNIKKKLATKKKIHFENFKILHIRTVDAWIRDYGPNFVIRENGPKKELAFNHWIFNAWGEKYPASIADTHVPDEIAQILKVPTFSPGIVLEGGSIDVNGDDICLTTEQCLLSSKRNPHLQKMQIENHLKDYLGVEHVLWLGKGIAGDDTDGHVDDIARFVDPETVVCALEEDPQDGNFEALKDNYKRLQSATFEGKKLRVIPLPMPGPVSYRDERLPASYANFYIANDVVLVPIFGHANDPKALAILQDLFPKRKAIGLSCNAMVVGHGTLHCVTQQQPRIK